MKISKLKLFLFAWLLLLAVALPTLVSAASSQSYTCDFNSIGGVITGGNCTPSGMTESQIRPLWDTCTSGVLNYTSGGPYPADGGGTYTLDCSSSSAVVVSPPKAEVPQSVMDALGVDPFPQGLVADGGTWTLEKGGSGEFYLNRAETDQNGVNKVQQWRVKDGVIECKNAYLDESGWHGGSTCA